MPHEQHHKSGDGVPVTQISDVAHLMPEFVREMFQTERGPNTKLTYADYFRRFKLHQSGMTYRKVGEIEGVTAEGIRNCTFRVDRLVESWLRIRKGIYVSGAIELRPAIYEAILAYESTVEAV